MRGLCATALLVIVMIAPGAASSALQAPPGETAPRIALLVGVNEYRHVRPLFNPASDVILMAETLTGLRFQVSQLTDPDEPAFERALIDFQRRVRQAGPETVALVYFAGHGVEVDGENFLLPADFNAASEDEVRYSAISLSDVSDMLEQADARVNFLIVDACRDNPLATGRSGGGGGLAPIDDAPRGTLIAYATAPGAVAADGSGANSPYASALARALTEPGLPAEMAFKRAGDLVLAFTADQQVPWYNSSLSGEDFYFAGRSAGGPGQGPVIDDDRRNDGLIYEADRAFWDQVSSSRDAADFERYIARYPQGLYADIAQQRISELYHERQRQEREAREAADSDTPALGVRISPVAPVGRNLVAERAAPSGSPSWAWIVDEVAAGSPFEGELLSGDVILTIDHTRVSEIDDPARFITETYDTRGRVDLLVRRGGASYALAVRKR
ncbi:MAG: caspase family protein [Oceanicaulis sp.]